MEKIDTTVSHLFESNHQPKKTKILILSWSVFFLATAIIIISLYLVSSQLFLQAVLGLKGLFLLGADEENIKNKGKKVRFISYSSTY